MGEDARQLEDPRASSALVRLFKGFGYLFEGWGFVLGKHPSLIKYCLMPLLINVLVFAGVAVGLYHYYGDLVQLIWAQPDSWFYRAVWYVLYVFILALILLLAYVAFFVVQAALSAPFNDLLSERVEQLALGREPPPFSWGRLGRGIFRALTHELAKLGVYLALMAPLFLANLVIPVVGPPLFLVGGYYLTATFFAYDFMDYSMDRREWTFRRKRSVLKQNRALTFGFGAALAVALLIPVVGLISVPMAAVGGTLLFSDLDRAGALEEQGAGKGAG